MTEEASQTSSVRSFLKTPFWIGLLIGLSFGSGGGLFAGKNLFSDQLDPKKFDEMLASIQDRLVTPFSKQNEIPKEQNIIGDWIYSASSEGKFKEGVCHERSGITHISKGGSNEYNVHGERKQRSECDDSAKKKIINWDSEYAPLIVLRNKLIVWFHTNDDPQSLGLMLLDISSNTAGDTEKLSGPMFYLEESSKSGESKDSENVKTWIRANIVFYKEGTEKASEIKSSWR